MEKVWHGLHKERGIYHVPHLESVSLTCEHAVSPTPDQLSSAILKGEAMQQTTLLWMLHLCIQVRHSLED